MEWTLYCASGKSRFITSDRPVIVDSADEAGISRGLKDMRTTVTFALSGTALLQLKHRNWLVDAVRKRSRNEPARRRKPANPVIAVLQADDAFVDSLNALQANHAHLWVFSGGCGQNWLSDWSGAPRKKRSKLRRPSTRSGTSARTVNPHDPLERGSLSIEMDNPDVLSLPATPAPTLRRVSA